jgi:endonuclease/exonuclease/phosphatase family metal-dependent hydrolase
MKEKDALTVGKNVQWVTFKDKNLTICNFHGIWNGQGKTDTEDRINQSKNIINALKSFDTEIVLCGDFNLLPETKSLQMIKEDLGFRDLIEEYNVTSTRTSHYTKEPKFADYVFVSKGITVKDFKVLPDEVSDHAPLYVEVE